MSDSFTGPLVAGMCAVTVWGCLTAWAWADLAIKDRVTDRQGRVIGQQTSLYTEKKARIDGPGFTLIADLEKKRSYAVDHKKRIYAQFDLEKMEAITRSAEKDMERRDGAGRLEAAVNRLKDENGLRIVPIRQTRTIKGLAAQKVEVYRGRELILETWYSSKVGTREYRAVMEAVARFQSRYAAPRPEAQVFGVTKELGYPVQVRDVLGGITVELEEVNEQKQPDSAFRVPAGYREVGVYEFFGNL